MSVKLLENFLTVAQTKRTCRKTPYGILRQGSSSLWASRSSDIPVLFLFGFLPFLLQFIPVEGFDILPRLQEILYPLFCFPVSTIRLLFAGQQFCVFLPQFTNCRQLFEAGFVKGILGGLMERDLRPVFLKELSAISCFPVSVVYFPCLT